MAEVNKLKNPYSLQVRRVARKFLPDSVYRRWMGRHEDGVMDLWRLLAARVSADEAILDIGAYHLRHTLRHDRCQAIS